MNIKDIKVYVYDNENLKLGEIVFYVVVKNNYLFVIKILLVYCEESVINCLNVVGRWFLYEVVYYNNYNVLQVMFVVGVNIFVCCNLCFKMLCLIQKCCFCEFILFYIVVKYGYYSVV